MQGHKLTFIFMLLSGVAAAQSMTCDLGSYKPVNGATA
jgi:hypothetical protein